MIGDLGGVLSVVVPDAKHYGAERSLVPSATFCVGASVTALAQGNFRFDSQQSTGDGGSAFHETVVAEASADFLPEPLPSLSKPLPRGHEAPCSRQSGFGRLRQGPEAKDQVLSFVAADASGSLVAARNVSPSTHTLLMAVEAALRESATTAPLSGRCQEAFRSRGSSIRCGSTAGVAQSTLMADGDLLAIFMDLSFNHQQACVQAAVAKLAASVGSVSGITGEAAATTPPLGASQLSALTIAVASCLESVMKDIE